VQGLKTLAAFLDWVPASAVLGSNLIEMLTGHFVDPPMYREHAIECLTEIASIKLDIGPQHPDFPSYLDKILSINGNFLTKL
jgi:hypothetical protein